jgi:hypothetical protein
VDSFGLSGDTRAYDTPMSKSFVHTSHSTQSNPIDGAGVALEPGHRYCELIGSLLYLANTTRPDIAHRYLYCKGFGASIKLHMMQWHMVGDG